jgi:hypothetical protein
MREETALTALASVRLWHWASAARPLLGLFSCLSGSSRPHPLVCGSHVVRLRRCRGGRGGAPAGSTRAYPTTRECGASLAPKLWYPQSRSASARKSERSHTRAAFPLQGEKEKRGSAAQNPPCLSRGSLQLDFQSFFPSILLQNVGYYIISANILRNVLYRYSRTNC